MSQAFTAQHLRDEALANADDEKERNFTFPAMVVCVGLLVRKRFRLLP